MKTMINIFALFLLLAGISLIIEPDVILGWIEKNRENILLYLSGTVVRIIYGIIFIIAASQSKFPIAIKVLGSVFIVTAIILIVMGQESFQVFIGSLIPHMKPYSAISGLASIILGGFLYYAFTRNTR